MSPHPQGVGGHGGLFLPMLGQRVSLDGPTPNPAAGPGYPPLPAVVLPFSSYFSPRLSSLVPGGVGGGAGGEDIRLHGATGVWGSSGLSLRRLCSAWRELSATCMRRAARGR